MKLWTLQPIEVWEELQQKGVFICNPEKAELLTDDLDFKNSYDWLVEEMEKRVGKRPEGVTYPIWAWHTRKWLRKKPDLRESGPGERGAAYVCLEIEKPENEVLLSDYDAWHFVMNNWFLNDSKSEEEWKVIDEWFDSLPKYKQDLEKSKSWQKIFDITPYKTDWFVRGEYIQATFWELKLEEVKKVQVFRCR